MKRHDGYEYAHLTSDDEIEMVCRGEHRWRVVGFDFKARVLTEKCAACGAERARAANTAIEPIETRAVRTVKASRR